MAAAPACRGSRMWLNSRNLLVCLLLLAAHSAALSPFEPPYDAMPRNRCAQLLSRHAGTNRVDAVTSLLVDKNLSCSGFEDPANLMRRGLVVLRNVVPASAVAEAESVFQGGEGSDSKNEGGRRYRGRFGTRELQRQMPSLLDSLERALSGLHAEGHAPESVDTYPDHGQDGPELHVKGAEFIYIDPFTTQDYFLWVLNSRLFGATAEALGLRRMALRHAATYMEERDGVFAYRDWHVDGDGYMGSRLHKLWVMLRKPAHVREHSNIQVAPYDNLDAACQVAATLDAGTSGSDTAAALWGRTPRSAALKLNLAPGASDLLFVLAELVQQGIKIREIFEAIPSDASGAVRTDHIAEAMLELQLDVTPPRPAEAIAHFDVSGDGAVNVDEFADTLKSFLGTLKEAHDSGPSKDMQFSAEENEAVQKRFFDSVGCTLTLDPGDALLMLEDLLHRTQDMVAERTALLVNVL